MRFNEAKDGQMVRILVGTRRGRIMKVWQAANDWVMFRDGTILSCKAVQSVNNKGA